MTLSFIVKFLINIPKTHQGNEFKLNVDPMPDKLKEGLRNWYHDYASGGRNRIRLDFPIHL